ncbi:unnamed protein product [Somion occarium]|uniref:Uncharacterized protein n=1 Tax=Somion occarium TaxID=3059160 RepID=A0ABP1EAG2_9APHY
MPSLQSFELISEACGICCSRPSSQGVLQSVALPRLQKLHLRLDVDSVYAYLLHCTFPASAIVTLNVEVKHDHALPDKPNVIRSVITQSCDMLGNEPITGLAIHFQSIHATPDSPRPSRMYVKTYNDEPSSIDAMESPPNFTIYFSHRQNNHGELLQKLLLHLRLSEVKYLRIDTSPSCRVVPGDLAKFLASLISYSSTGLDTLSMSGLCIDILPSLLSLPLHHWPLTPGGREMGLFGCLKTLVLSDIGHSMRWRESNPQIADLCEAIRSQTKIYRSSCGPFSRLVLQSCREERDSLLGLVDAIAELFYQEGRFTQDLALIPYKRVPRFSHLTRPVIDYPNSDLDFGQWNSLQPVALPTEGDWVEHVRMSGRVAFDFRGNEGVTIEERIYSHFRLIRHVHFVIGL